MSEFRKQAEDHWNFIEGIITIFLKLAKWLYIQGMIHGYKHGKKEAEV